MNAQQTVFEIKLAWRYLMGRKLRTLLTTLAVAFGVMIVFGLDGLIPTMMEAFRATTSNAVDKVDLTVKAVGGGVFDPAAVETVRAATGVETAIGSLRRVVALPVESAPRTRLGAPINTIDLTGVDLADENDLLSMRVTAGRSLQVGDTDVVVIPGTLMAATGLRIGGSLTIPAAAGHVTLKIVGAVSGPSLAGEFNVIVPLGTAQRIFASQGKINTIEVTFLPGADAAATGAGVLQKLGAGFDAGRTDSLSTFYAMAGLGEMAFNILGWMALLMGGFIIFNTFRTLVAERRRDIGILRALGATRRTIIRLILVESLLQGVIGTAAGMLAGWILDESMVILINPITIQYMHIQLGYPLYSAGALLTSIGLGIGVTVLAGLLPAVNASRVTPLDALRPALEQGIRGEHNLRGIMGGVMIVLSLACMLPGSSVLTGVGVLLFLTGLLIVSPLLVRPVTHVYGRIFSRLFASEGSLAEGNVSRQPERATVTASAILISLAIIVALFTLAISVGDAFQKYIATSLGSDYLLTPQTLVLAGGNVGASPDFAAKIRAIPGIQAVTSLRVSSASAEGVQLQVIGIDPTSYAQISGLVFKEGGPGKAFSALSAGHGIIVNGIFAAQRHLHTGDQVTLDTAVGKQIFTVAGVGIDYINAKLSAVYISQADMSAFFNENSDVLIMANKTSQADPVRIKADLEKVIGDYPAFTLYDSAEWRIIQMQTFRSVMRLIYVLMLVIAIPALIALINTLAINVIERTREFGVLRAVGATRSQVRRVILAESLLLAAFGTGFGILGGVALGYTLVVGINASGFIVSYSLPALGIWITLALGLIFGGVAALIPASQVAGLDIVNALHYE